MSSKSQKRPCATVGLVEAISKATDPLPPTVGVLSATLYMLQSPLLFLSLANSFAPRKLNLFLFKRFRTLCPKTPGGGVSLRLADGNANLGRASRKVFVEFITCPEGVHRTYYWSRRFTPPVYSRATGSVVSEYVYLRGRVRWVSSLVVGSSLDRASPFFVPTNN